MNRSRAVSAAVRPERRANAISFGGRPIRLPSLRDNVISALSLADGNRYRRGRRASLAAREQRRRVYALRRR